MSTSSKLQPARWLSAIFALLLIVSCAPAADTTSDPGTHSSFGNMFASGGDVHLTGSTMKDLYAAGGSVTVDADVAESAHMAGRTVRVNRPVGEDVYAAGYEVDIEAPVGEDLTAAGYRVEIGRNASVRGDVLARGRTIFLRGPVSGNVSLSGDTVEIAAPISGSAEIRAREIRFGDGARIDGTLNVSSPEPVSVPASVIPADRVTTNVLPADMGVFIGNVLTVVFSLIVLGLAAVFAYVFRDRLAGTRAVIASRPWGDLLFGIIATSALFGSIVVLTMSLIGIPLIPLVVFATPFVIFAGYLTTAHAIGAVVIRRARLLPGNFWAAFGAILLGAIVLGLAMTIPLIGWVIAVLAVVVGVGAWLALLVWPARRGDVAAAR
jgi:cytoskeletal protein CcmA (bactofilin family)